MTKKLLNIQYISYRLPRLKLTKTKLPSQNYVHNGVSDNAKSALQLISLIFLVFMLLNFES